jgi:hypothetical protein
VVGRIRFALERFASPRHSSHVAQLFSLGHMSAHLKNRKLQFVVCLFLGLVLIYVLSEGFAYRCLMKATLSQSSYTKIYGPIVFVCHHNSYIEYLDWKYDSLWYDENAEWFKDLDAQLKTNGIVEKK